MIMFSSVARHIMLLFIFLTFSVPSMAATFEMEKAKLASLITQYRDTLSLGLSANYQVTCKALDKDDCTAIWKEQNVFLNKFHRFSWQLSSASPNISQHENGSHTIYYFTDCATASTPDRLEFLARKDGSMSVYTFSKSQKLLLQEPKNMAELYPLIVKFNSEVGRHDVPAVLIPLTFLNGDQAGAILPRIGMKILFDDTYVHSAIEKFQVIESTTTKMVFKAAETESDFWNNIKLRDPQVTALTPEEKKEKYGRSLREFGGFSRSVTLEKLGNNWRITKVENGRWNETNWSTTITYDETGIPKTCFGFVTNESKASVRYDLLNFSKKITVADLAIDPSEARSITDAATGMTIEPQ